MAKSAVMGGGGKVSAVLALDGAPTKKILPRTEAAVAVDKSPDDSPLRITIEQAHNGWSVSCSGAGMPYSGKPHVATSTEEAMKIVEGYMNDAMPMEEESDDEDSMEMGEEGEA